MVSGVSCVVSTIADVEDVLAMHLMVHFYRSLLGLEETDVTAGVRPLDSVEALQAAMLQQKQNAFQGDNNAPQHWAGYIISGLPVDNFGPKT